VLALLVGAFREAAACRPQALGWKRAPWGCTHVTLRLPAWSGANTAPPGA